MGGKAEIKAAFDGSFDDVSAAVLVCVAPLGKIVSVNVEAEELTGYERAELEGMELSEIFRPEDQSRIRSIFSASVAADFKKLVEHNVIVRKRSRRKIVVDMGFRRSKEAGRGDAFVFTLQDITDLKANEERVVRAHEYVNSIIDSIAEIMLVVDENDLIEKANAATLSLLGFEEGEIVGQSIAFILPEIARAHGSYAETETVVRRKDGRAIPVLASKSELRSHREAKSGGRGKTVLMAMDISERKKAERLISEQQMMLVQASKMSSLGEMASSIGHEINNPLTVVLGRCEILEMRMEKAGIAETDEIALDVKLIDKMSRRILKIVRGLQALARDQRHDAMEEVDLNDILRETLAVCEQRIRSGLDSLELPKMEEVILLRCRPTQISQVLLNLLNNSYDEVAGKPLAWIRIEVEVGPSELRLVVTDSGRGIPAPVAEKLFTPFFTTKPVGKGTGIGLSVSKSLIESHEGTLTLDDSSKNTRFVIRLPRAQGAKKAG